MEAQIDPLSLDAVLLYAQAGSGRLSLFTDYTFGLWMASNHPAGDLCQGLLGLNDQRSTRLTAGSTNTLQRFGPVRSVKLVILKLALRGFSLKPPQIRNRCALPAHPALAPGQTTDEATLQTAEALLQR